MSRMRRARGRRTRPRLVVLVTILVGTLAGATPSPAAVQITVTSANDVNDGACTAPHCSLREAIVKANATAEADVIVFAIPGSPPFRITPASLPKITAPVTIDGTTQAGYAGVPLIELDGSLAGSTGRALYVGGGNSVIEGLAVYGFKGASVQLASGGNTLRASRIGVDGAGTVRGGIGAAVSGTGNIVGGAGSGEGNLIRGAANRGILISGRSTRVEGNRILDNAGPGILVKSGSGHLMTRNTLDGNAGLGIDLMPTGVTANDAGDGDRGVNGLQNTPEVATAVRASGTTVVEGTLRSKANVTYTIEVFGSAACDPSGHGEGETSIAKVTAASNAQGLASFSVSSSSPALEAGRTVTATATDPSGNTSELSGCATVAEGGSPPPPGDDRPNFLLILTDDQAPDTFPQDPPAMPLLQARVQDPTDHWIEFTNAFVNTPLCCPSRATVLTGQYAHHHGVESIAEAAEFDDTNTLATWLDDAGYHTGLVGKYFVKYPFSRPAFVPPGWDRWAAFVNAPRYYGYNLYVDDGSGGSPVKYGSAPADYATDVLRDRALAFLNGVPAGTPFFLSFDPPAAHGPFTPAPRHDGLWDTAPLDDPPSLNEADVSDKPGWLQSRPLLTAEELANLAADRRNALETLAAADEAIDALLENLEDRGLLENTIVVVASDNGYAFGEHRLEGKVAPYRESVATPLLVRVPGATPRTEPLAVSLTDLAPTFAELAGVTPGLTEDGRSLVSLLEGTAAGWPDEALVQLANPTGPRTFWGIRTARYAYNEWPSSGEIELYDRLLDPYELENLCPGSPPSCDPAYEAVRQDLADRLAELRDT